MPIGVNTATRQHHVRAFGNNPTGPPNPPPPGTPIVTIGPTVKRTSSFKPGWVHTQNDPNTGLTAGEYTILGNSAPAQAQPLQGFGLGAIWPTQAGAKSWG